MSKKGQTGILKKGRALRDTCNSFCKSSTLRYGNFFYFHVSLCMVKSKYFFVFFRHLQMNKFYHQVYNKQNCDIAENVKILIILGICLCNLECFCCHFIVSLALIHSCQKFLGCIQNLAKYFPSQALYRSRQSPPIFHSYS